MVSLGTPISIIWLISLDGRKIQKHCVVANVNVDGKHWTQFIEIFNSAYRSSVVETAFWWPVKNGAKMKKTGSRKSVKRKWRLFSVMIVGAGRLFVFFLPVKVIWLII